MKKTLKNKPIISVLFLSLIIRIIFLFDYHPIWWDSAVYIGMGKHIFSLAQQGLWEPIRPVLWPIVLGLIWKIKLSPVFFSRILILIISLLVVYLTYSITRILFNKESALISSILISFSSIFFFFNFRIYTEIPTVLFVLFAFLFVLKKRYLFSGMFISFAFLTKFPSGIFLLCLIPLLFSNKKLKDNLINLKYYIIGFLIPVIPYFILNHIIYRNLLFPFISASKTISLVVGCNYLRYQPWHYYFIIILKDNFFFLFSLIGMFLSIKRFNKQNLSLLLCSLLPLLYFIQLHCREYRYIILFLPFIAVLSGIGIDSLMRTLKLNNIIKKITIIAILLISMSLAFFYYHSNEPIVKIMPQENFLHFAENKTIENQIWTTNPSVNLFVDKKVELLYYPVYSTQKIDIFTKEIISAENISMIFLDTCSGGMTCSPLDTECHKRTGQLIDDLDKIFKLSYKESFGECDYYIFEK